MSLRILSLNSGANADDGLKSLMHEYLTKHKTPPWTREDCREAFNATKEGLADKYSLAQEKTAELLLKDDVRPHLICFQEALEFNDRPIIRELLKRGFQFFHSKDKGNIVAVDPSRFQVLSDLSVFNPLDNEGLARVKLRDRITGYEMLVASVWASGFDFQVLEKQKLLEGGVPKGEAGAPFRGDKYCSWVAQLVSQVGLPRMAFVGADMNASYMLQAPDDERPNIYPGQWNQRYEYFTKEGFIVLQPPINVATNVNPNPGEPIGTHTRCIDAGLVRLPTEEKLSTWKWVARLVYNVFFEVLSDPQARLREDFDPLNGFDPTKNASDHRPLFFEIHFKRHPSWISRLLFNQSVETQRTVW